MPVKVAIIDGDTKEKLAVLKTGCCTFCVLLPVEDIFIR